MKPKVLFLLPYPLHRAPSQRFRVEAFFSLLNKEGVSFTAVPFLDDKAWKVLYQQGSGIQKARAVLRGFAKRFITVCFNAGKYEYVFVHREAAPLGPPIFEWLLSKVFRKKLIYDFDDAIWIPNVTESNRLAGSVKCSWKIACICKWAYKIAAGNDYLAQYALRNNSQVIVLPTGVDTENRFNQIKNQSGGKVVIGWTGSHSTLTYLDAVYPVLKKLELSFDFDFLVICNEPPAFQLQSLKFIRWQETTEIEDLLKMDIGIMPLVQDAWSEGKCGFKIIQYLSLGIPAVASRVGVNKVIIEQSQNGFLCSTEQEWYDALRLLIQNESLRMQLGKAGREKIRQQYSIEANAKNFLSLFS